MQSDKWKKGNEKKRLKVNPYKTKVMVTVVDGMKAVRVHERCFMELFVFHILFCGL